MWNTTVANVMAELSDITVYEHTILGISTSFGSAVGSIFFSALSDRYGRAYIFKKIIIVTTISALLLICSMNYVMVLIAVFFIGLGTGGDIICAPTMIIESVPPSKKGRIALMNMGYCLGPLLTQLVSILLTLYWDQSIMERWRIMAIIIFIITLIVLVIRQFILESPIFLYGNRNTEFVSVMVGIAKENKRFSFAIRAPLLVSENDEEQYKVVPHLPFSNIFKDPYTRATIFLTISISLFNFCYNGILLFLPKFLQVDDMGERYLILGIQQVSGICGLVVAMYMVDSGFGRRWTLALGYIASGILLLIFMLSTNFQLIVLLGAAYYFAMLIGIAGKNLIGPESYGPQVRGAGLGFVYTVARVAAVISPAIAGYLMDISNNNHLLPLSVYAVAMILCGVSGAFLKDTKPILTKTT
eukprot:CAMPEP_0202948918 /NCGR_PEP_ID=MMETSP1395-20130829/14770_1 /ASSEMBLY_ACC=CAM_ASM_000871 /TAXON_ID=5961 /ORGANISM="Blepharisma japonicum, Strain Stock R1072" /LENGTH=414 /DNA_ID=CAMNT_0049651471 /DNA_START=88 /DNA_END=1332 /DNA_ORIENTATION=-